MSTDQPNGAANTNSDQPDETAMTDDSAPPSDVMLMVIDDTRCIGAGQCEMLAPDHFRVDDDSALAAWVGEGSLPRTEAETLIDRCPSGALSVIENTDEDAVEGIDPVEQN